MKIKGYNKVLLYDENYCNKDKEVINVMCNHYMLDIFSLPRYQSIKYKDDILSMVLNYAPKEEIIKYLENLNTLPALYDLLHYYSYNKNIEKVELTLKNIRKSIDN